MLIGGAADCPDMEYASGFRAVDPVVFLKKGRQAHLVVPELEFGRASKTARRGVQVHTPRQLGVGRGKQRSLDAWALALARHTGLRHVRVPFFFPYGVAARLARAGIRAAVATGSLFPERAMKTPEEVHRITESQQAAVIAMRAAIRQIASARIDGRGYLRWSGGALTSRDVRQTIMKVLFQHDCTGREIIVAGGEDAVDPHQVGEGPLRAHEAIVIDIFPQHQSHGYWGDLTRTVVKGAPPAELRRVYQAVKAAQAAALSRVRPGVKCSSIHSAAVAEFERRGCRTFDQNGTKVGFIHGTGHGLGLAIHEPPWISRADGWLKSGHVITIEPGLYYPGIGGVRIEDTIVVTAGGWRHLAPCEKRFEV